MSVRHRIVQCSLMAWLGGLACGSNNAQSKPGVSPTEAGPGVPPVEAGPGVPPVEAGPPPHVLRACPTLEAGASAVWENATPPAVGLDAAFKTGAGNNYGTNAFVVDPIDRATVYLGTSGQGLYKTTDCAATWTKINTGANGGMLDKGRNWTMAIDPRDPRGVIYTNAGYGPGGVWKSVNGGVDWQQMLPPDVLSVFVFGGFVEWIAMDPTNPQHLIVTPHFTCTGAHGPNCMLETADGGTTWKVIDKAPAVMENSGQMMVDSKTWFYAEDFGGLWRTADQGATWTVVANPKGYALHSIYRDPNGNYYVPAAFNLITSPDGITWHPLANSPAASTVAGSSTTIYLSHGSCVNPATTPFQPYSSASVNDPTTWHALASPPTAYGAGYLEYDEDHHILYASSCRGGFWRVVTQ